MGYIFSQVGGFKSNILSIFGIITACTLPFLFTNKLSNQISLEKDNDNKNVGN